MEHYSEILVKPELIKQELLVENELKLEQDMEQETLEDAPEYVDVTMFSSELPNKSEKPPKEMFYKCNYCPSKYKKVEYLTIHNVLHSDTKVCVVCNEIINCKKKLRNHLNQHIKENIEKDKKNHICGYCQKTFSNKKSLIIHTRVHTNERPYKCEICGEAFKQSGSLKVHYVTHTKERQFVCEICSGSYTTASSLKRHIRRIHDKGKVLKCKICGAEMYNMADFKSHKLNVHPGKGYKRKCQICLEVFYTRAGYRDHYRSQHKQFLDETKSIIKTFLCLLCGEKFVSSQLYADHRRMHLGYTEEELNKAKERGLFKCKVCSKEVKVRDSLYKHMELHLEKNFKCIICNKHYSYFRFRMHAREVHHTLQCRVCLKVHTSKRNLENHYRAYHPTVRKKFHCTICGQQFILKNKLNLHILLIHKQNIVKNYKCSHCGERFLLANTLARHLAKSHKKRLKYKCQLCSQTFNSRKEHINHKLSHKATKNSHNVNKRKRQNEQKKHFRCRICLKIFNLRSNYKNHLGENNCYKFINNVRKQQKCHICFKYLNSRITLKYHMKLHSDKEFMCRICGKLFNYVKAVRRHMRRTHPNEKVYWCECCKRGFDKFADLNDHNMIHVGKGDLVDRKDNITRGNYSNTIKKEEIDIKDEPIY